MSKITENEVVEVFSLAFGGKSVARRESGKVCFLQGVLPYEKVRIAVIGEKKNFSTGKVLEILEKSPARVREHCILPCPGCPYRMMEYSLELQWKEKQLLSFLARLKKMKLKNILPAVGAEERLAWRSKISLHLVNGELCYTGWDNLTPVPVKECPLADKRINEFLSGGKWREKVEPGAERVTFRCTEKDGVTFHTDKSRDKVILTEELGIYGTFLVEQRSFFQINHAMAQKLISSYLATVEKLAPQNILELYCGCGVFSLLAAERCHIPCRGIELDASSIHLAKENAANRGVENLCKFYAGDAGKVMKSLYGGRKVAKGTLLVVDPPRTGLAPNAAEMLLAAESDWILYISCGPDTLMRDLESLAQKYSAEEIQLFDLFPSTAHFETLVLLKKNSFS